MRWRVEGMRIQAEISIPRNYHPVENSLLQLIQIINTNIPNTRVKLSSCRSIRPSIGSSQ
ncbi:hypothetical protein Acr_02g0012830 [Actinidia rufa]|uniref:Uncharacterized protein n=1 Tax=Actinidia rufa TaxID=165716 RepID=A0A7J0E987_9ERIC|nr:hypothetical protein Acr_02g0012830 [Actinidia rufa]